MQDAGLLPVVEVDCVGGGVDFVSIPLFVVVEGFRSVDLEAVSVSVKMRGRLRQ